MAERDDFSYEVVTDLWRLDAMADEWNLLLEATDCNRAFSSFTWFSTACRCLGRRPTVLLARRGARLAGILPMVEGADRNPTFLTYLNDYNDLIAAGDDVAAAAGLINFLLSRVAAGNPVVVRRVRSDSLLLKGLRRSDSRLRASATEVCSYIDLKGDRARYPPERPGRFSESVRRATRLAAKSGLVVKEARPEALSAESLPAAFLSLHLSRFPTGSAFESRQAQAFIFELLPRLYRQGRLRVFAAFEGASLIAIDICMVGKKSLCSWNGGFFPEAARWSPGKLLLDFEIRLAREDGLDELDLLRGPQPWKRRWATGTRYVAEIELPHRQARSAVVD